MAAQPAIFTGAHGYKQELTIYIMIKEKSELNLSTFIWKSNGINISQD
jgi:hypothetical protein